jgi:hypothetical protein
MGSFLKSSGIYLFIGFIVVVVAGISFLVYQRLQVVNTPQEVTQEPTQENAELSFSLEGSPAPALSKTLTCTDLSSTVSDKDQKTITFTAKIQAVPQSTVSYLFTFEGSKDGYLDKEILAENGQDTLTITNTFPKPGTYDVELSMIDDNGNMSNTCKTQVTVVSEGIENQIPTVTGTTQIALVPTGTTTPINSLSPTKQQVTPTKQPSPTPTSKPSVTPTGTQQATTSLSTTPYPTTAEDESIPVPDVPEAGGFAPTIVATLGGSGIILLAFLLRRMTP